MRSRSRVGIGSQKGRRRSGRGRGEERGGELGRERKGGKVWERGKGMGKEGEREEKGRGSECKWEHKSVFENSLFKLVGVLF